MAETRSPMRRLRDRVISGETTPEFVVLAGTVLVLMVLGLVMIFSASFVRSAADTGGAFDIFGRQLLWSALGLPVLVGAAMVDYRHWRRVAIPLVVVALVAGIVVLIPGVGIVAHGARRWIDLGPVRFQPTELMKLAIPMYVAHVLALRWPRLRAGDLHALLLPAAPLLVFSSVIVLAEPDLETAALIALIGGVVLYAAGLPGRIITTGLAGTLLLGTVAIVSTPFRRARMLAWLDPMAHADTFGYQSVQGFIALGSGGWWGVGLGQGRGKWLYIPNAHTDFIYAIIGEELGLVGALFVLVLYAVIAVIGTRTAQRAVDPFGRLLAAAITGWMALQAGMNMGSVVGLLPVTGVTLPLISFGGSSLVFSMLALGILMSISRHPAPRRAAATTGRRS